jgi:hypothetical protein
MAPCMAITTPNRLRSGRGHAFLENGEPLVGQGARMCGLGGQASAGMPRRDP